MRNQPIVCTLRLDANPNHICRNCILPGDKLYYVMALSERSYIEEHIVQGKPYQSGNIGLFVKTTVDGSSNQFSLDDANIIPNKYNYHKMFRVEQDATNYQKHCIETKHCHRYQSGLC